MMEVACVKWGSKYPADWVNRLACGVQRNLTLPHRMICYTDDPIGVQCETRELPAGLTGWWNKLWLFQEPREAMLFFDLDVVIVGNLNALTQFNGFTIVKDGWQKGYNSSVMFLKGDLTHVWEQFMRDRPDSPVAVPGRRRMHGDQDWITHALPNAMLFPRVWCESYKIDLCGQQRGGRLPAQSRPPSADARVVYFHGDPKPDTVAEAWVRQHWRVG